MITWKREDGFFKESRNQYVILTGTSDMGHLHGTIHVHPWIDQTITVRDDTGKIVGTKVIPNGTRMIIMSGHLVGNQNTEEMLSIRPRIDASALRFMRTIRDHMDPTSYVFYNHHHFSKIMMDFSPGDVEEFVELLKHQLSEANQELSTVLQQISMVSGVPYFMRQKETS